MAKEFKRAEHDLTCRPVVGDGKNPVPEYFTGCSNCGCVFDMYYTTCGFKGPPNYCPRCGAMVIEDE